jgi:nucleotide-binding universal stress UspA family protein
MIKNIMVPLDGSKLAECALEYAEDLAAKPGVEKVILVSVTERVKGFSAIEDPNSPTEIRLMPEASGKMEKQAANYLNRIGKGLESRGIKVEKEVLYGDPAEEITIYCENGAADLIVMSSHGRSGPSRWAHGSVAEKVLRSAKIPVMIIRSPACSGVL